MIEMRHRPTLGALFLLLFTIFWTLPPATAVALECGRRGPIVASLARIYGEYPVATGLGHAGLAVEVFAAADGATFTILRSWPNDVSCVLEHGENWRAEKLHPDIGDEGA